MLSAETKRHCSNTITAVQRSMLLTDDESKGLFIYIGSNGTTLFPLTAPRLQRLSVQTRPDLFPKQNCF